MSSFFFCRNETSRVGVGGKLQAGAHNLTVKMLISLFGTKPIQSSLALSTRCGKKCEYKSCEYEEIKAKVQERS